MFHFFRNIRKQLISNRWAGRYLGYALGEIALVVIGILIALYLDEARDFREARRQELGYLEGFQRDLGRNLMELDRVIEKSGLAHQGADSLLTGLALDTAGVPSEKLLRYLPQISGYTVFLGFDGTLEDLLGSGNLAVIRNDSIRIALATWKSELGLMRELESLGKDSFKDLSDHLTRSVPILQVINADSTGAARLFEHLLGDSVFHGLVMTHAISMRSLHERYLEKKPLWEQLEGQVGREINRLRE